MDEYQAIEPRDESLFYKVDGEASLRATFAPNANFDMHSIELNDVRLNSSQYIINATYNGENVAVNLNGFSFVIAPVKMATILTIVIA